ncbi:hypothetical protein GYMLUDRAFT_403808 [Collybiopsis luxurians FD-317 M1]|nr:hypothetical protein GYMLUDRAFT_403808 [Collybiopsis luxurians FD-317 M1]
MAGNIDGDLYSPFRHPVMVEEEVLSSQSSDGGSGLHSPVFESQFPLIRYQVDINDAASVLAHFDYTATRIQPIQPSALETPSLTESHDNFFPDYSTPFRSNHLGIEYVPQSSEQWSYDRQTHDPSHRRPSTRITMYGDQGLTPVSPSEPSTALALDRPPSRREVSAIVIACRQCRTRKIRCDSARPGCTNCHRRKTACEYDDAPKRRGPDKRPGTRRRSLKRQPADRSTPPPPKRKKAVHDSPTKDAILPQVKAAMLDENRSMPTTKVGDDGLHEYEGVHERAMLLLSSKFGSESAYSLSTSAPGGNSLVYSAPSRFGQPFDLSSIPALTASSRRFNSSSRTETNTDPASSSRTPTVSRTHLHHHRSHGVDNNIGSESVDNASASTSSVSSLVEGASIFLEDGIAESAARGTGSFNITAANLRRELSSKETGTRVGNGKISNWTPDSLVSYHKHDKLLVQQLVDVLQSDLDYTEQGHRDSLGIDLKVYYRRCLRSLRHLATHYEVLPSSLCVQDLRRTDQNPIRGGGFADIWRGTMQSNQSVCLKVLRLILEPDQEVREKIRKQFIHEALVWRQLKHPNILPLLGVNAQLFYPSFCLVSPWMENQDIIPYLKKNPAHSRHDVISEVAAGLLYLHSRDPPVIHGDIRGANVLVTADLHCCLADFGLSVINTESQMWSNATATNIRGAIRWMAPELQIPDSSGQLAENCSSTDVYALGCTIIEILTLQPPFHGKKNDGAIIFSLLAEERPARPQENTWCTDSLWKLVNQCWAQDPSARPDSEEIHDTLLRIRKDT